MDTHIEGLEIREIVDFKKSSFIFWVSNHLISGI